MDLDKISEKDMPLLGRKNLVLKASFTGSATPKKEILIKDIAKIAKSAEELIVIDKVEQKSAVKLLLLRLFTKMLIQ